MSASDIIVIGGGVSGLSCAHELAMAGKRVQLWTADPPARTTSRVAAAFWHAYRAEPVDRVGPWAVRTYERFAAMAMNPDIAPIAGIVMREAIELLRGPTPRPSWARQVDMFRDAIPDELPPGFTHGFVFEAPVIEMPKYLPWLVAQLERVGVEIVARRASSVDEALACARVVVNCTGLGAREFVGDPRVYAVRGQILHRRRGSESRVLIDDTNGDNPTYVVPRGEDVVLGGIADEGDERLDIDPAQSEDIAARCVALEPSLADAEPLGVSVGLRPCRDVVRLEAEEHAEGLVVHDYGHGGAGVTLSWGCAEDVRDIVLRWRP